jgi:hypothetical protein
MYLIARFLAEPWLGNTAVDLCSQWVVANILCIYICVYVRMYYVCVYVKYACMYVGLRMCVSTALSTEIPF